MTIPSSISMARRLIKDNPKLFTDHFKAEVLISKVMQDYLDSCRAFLNQDQPMINEIRERLNTLNNLKK